MIIRSTSVAVTMTAIVALAGCAVDTTEPDPEPTPSSSPANAPGAPSVDTGRVDSQAQFYCTGPRPLCPWPDIAVCTNGTPRNPGRWHCP